MNSNRQAPDTQPMGMRAPREICQRHMTLVEVLVAFGIFGIMIATSVTLYSYFLATDSWLMTRNASINIAQAHMDYLRTVDMAILQYANESEEEVNANGLSLPGGGFFRSTTVTTDSSGTFCRVQVDVRVPALVRRPEQRTSFSSIVMNRALINNLE